MDYKCLRVNSQKINCAIARKYLFDHGIDHHYINNVDQWVDARVKFFRVKRDETGPERRQTAPQMREDGSLLNSVQAKSASGTETTKNRPNDPPGMRNPRGNSGSVMRKCLTDNKVIVDVATRSQIYVAISWVTSKIASGAQSKVVNKIARTGVCRIGLSFASHG